MVNPRCAVWVVAVTSFAAAPVAARDHDRVVSMFVFARDPTLSDLAVAVESGLRAHAEEIPDLRILDGAELAGGRNGPSSRGPGATLSSIARMGRSAGADEVMIGRMQPSLDAPAGATLQLMTIGCLEGTITRKAAFHIASVDEVDSAIRAHWSAIYGIAGVGRVRVPGSAAELRVDGHAIGQGVGPFEVAAGPHVLAVADRSVRVLVLPGRTLQVDDLAPAPVPLEPPAAVVAPGPAPGTPGNSGLTYSGAALGALGLAALGTGAYFGSSSRSLNKRVDAVRRDGDSSQIRVAALNRDAARAARNANVFLIGGAAATAVGAALVALDLWVLDSAATARVVAQSDGDNLSAGLVLRW
jgi:hypothetical protein